MPYFYGIIWLTAKSHSWQWAWASSRGFSRQYPSSPIDCSPHRRRQANLHWPRSIRHGTSSANYPKGSSPLLVILSRAHPSAGCTRHPWGPRPSAQRQLPGGQPADGASTEPAPEKPCFWWRRTHSSFVGCKRTWPRRQYLRRGEADWGGGCHNCKRSERRAAAGGRQSNLEGDPFLRGPSRAWGSAAGQGSHCRHRRKRPEVYGHCVLRCEVAGFHHRPLYRP